MRTTIYVIIFLVLLLLLNAVVASMFQKPEAFAVESLPITTVRRWGRNIVFPYFADNNILLAPHRALPDPSANTYNAKCNLGDNTGEINESFSIVHEDGLFYNLKKACHALDVTSIKIIDKTEDNRYVKRMDVDFATDNKKLENLTKFILLNPLFVEFNVDLNVTVAYRVTQKGIPNNTSNTDILFNNINSDNKVTLRFEMLVDYNLPTNCDSSFDYKTIGKGKYKGIPVDYINNIMNVGVRRARKPSPKLTLWTYYLDEPCGSFQKTGRSFPIKNPLFKRFRFFSTNFKDYASNPQRRETYEFMNNISNLYYNYLSPVFTFSFKLKISEDQQQKMTNRRVSIMRAYFDNMKGTSISCHNNVAQVSMSRNNNGINFTLTSGDDNTAGNECGYITQPVLSVNVPIPPNQKYFPPQVYLHVTVTVSKTEKYIYVEWKDSVYGNDNGKRMFTYGKTQKTTDDPKEFPVNTCNFRPNDDTNNNALTRMFISKQTPRPPLANGIIELGKDMKINQLMTGVKLGYPNFNSIYNSNN